MLEREQTTIRLPADLKEQLAKEAQRRGYTITNLITLILWDYVHLSIAQE